MKYSILQQKFHELFLGNQQIKETIFVLEKLAFRNRVSDLKHNKHIFVSGLPRSGSTALLLKLHETKRFASLTYADMPLVMAPNIGRLLLSIKKNESVPRAHGDGIDINLSSPEALDQVFLKTYNLHRLPILQENYTDYVNLVLHRYKKSRYLSKNNNLGTNLRCVLGGFLTHLYLYPSDIQPSRLVHYCASTSVFLKFIKKTHFRKNIWSSLVITSLALFMYLGLIPKNITTLETFFTGLSNGRIIIHICLICFCKISVYCPCVMN